MLDYSHFDHIEETKKFIKDHNQTSKTSWNIEELRPRDEILLNPLSVILESHAEEIYEHPFVKQYITLKFRQDSILVGLILNLIFFCALVFSLTGFAVSIQPDWQILTNLNVNEVS